MVKPQIYLTERFFLDTEFIEDGKTIDLLSIAVVSEDGREFYAENADANLSRANDWVRENVLPHLFGPSLPLHIPHNEIGQKLIKFINANTTHRPEFWGYFSSYDWVVICQLFGAMIDLPEHWPMLCMDVKQLSLSQGDPELPKQSTTEHHALADAYWTREAYEFLINRKKS